MASLKAAFSSSVKVEQRLASEADGRASKLAAILDLLDKLATFEARHRTVDDLHFVTGRQPVAGLDRIDEIDSRPWPCSSPDRRSTTSRPRR